MPSAMGSFAFSTGVQKGAPSPLVWGNARPTTRSRRLCPGNAANAMLKFVPLSAFVPFAVACRYKCKDIAQLAKSVQKHCSQRGAIIIMRCSAETSPPVVAADKAAVDSVTSSDDSQADPEDPNDEEAVRMIGSEWALEREAFEPKVPDARLAVPRQSSQELPINALRVELQEAIAKQRVVILIGGTGCGKSTQVPQFILQDAAAQQRPANIFVTQPRRLAATSLARRVAKEMDLAMGREIGYKIRGEIVPADHLTYITAGYLLSWFTCRPSDFQHITHIVLDEAHIRTSDMELLLLMVRMLMRIYSGPKLVLMSATMQDKLFSDYLAEFAIPPGSTLEPISVGGRLFPVEVIHLDDLAQGILPRKGELSEELRSRARFCKKDYFSATDGGAVLARAKVWPTMLSLAQEVIPEVAEGGSTILVFLPGYSDLVRMHSWLYWNLPIAGSINMGFVPPKPEQLGDDGGEAEDADIEELRQRSGLPGKGMGKGMGKGKRSQVTRPGPYASASAANLEGVPAKKFRLFALHSQVKSEDQNLVLQEPEPDVCNVVLATTIAESSLTLPQVIGIVDFAVHKTSMGDPKMPGMTQLASVWCARSAALQREGRAGRTRPGWCIRMVPRSFFENHMPEHDTPQILSEPLTKLFLQAKGMADGLQAIMERDEAAKQLGVGPASASDLLMQLPSPPSKDAIKAAVHELAQNAVLTAEDPEAATTVLGKIALWLPLDVQLCRLVWLGSIFGCPAEAVVLAASCCAGASPFTNPSRLGFADNSEFVEHLRNTAESRLLYDGGHFSEPIAELRLFQAWLRRLGVTQASNSTNGRWVKAAQMLSESTAIDESRMLNFVGYIADIAIRAREMCDDARGEDSCSVRDDLHGLICLLRRPDKTFKELKESLDGERVPRIGDVFRATPKKIYALLAAAFSDKLMIGKHRYATQSNNLQAMFDALDSLKKSGIAMQDAILIPDDRGQLRNESKAFEVVASIVGEPPTEVASTKKYLACSFSKAHDDVEDWLKSGGGSSSSSSTPRWRWDNRNMGLPPVSIPRLSSLDSTARLCHTAAGGMRTFKVEDLELTRATSPYELGFNIAHATKQGSLIAIIGEQTPLGYACHVTSPEVPLGSEHFACVAAAMTLAESGAAARAHSATLLNAEELIFAMTTLCPGSVKLNFAFAQGPGGSESKARASLAAMRFGGSRPLKFRHHLPGLMVIEKLNQVRSNILEALVTPSEFNSSGREILFWEDDAARKAFDDLLEFIGHVVETEPERDLGVPDQREFVWCDPSSEQLQVEMGDADYEEDDEFADFNDGDDANDDADIEDGSNIEALQQINLLSEIESAVAQKTSRKSAKTKHKFECPDCGDQFMMWKDALDHFIQTGHLDVSTEKARSDAKTTLALPVKFRCLECFAGFPTWELCKQHLDEAGHLAFAEPLAQRHLCQPVQNIDAEAAGQKLGRDMETSGGFFRSLVTTPAAPRQEIESTQVKATSKAPRRADTSVANSRVTPSGNELSMIEQERDAEVDAREASQLNTKAEAKNEHKTDARSLRAPSVRSVPDSDVTPRANTASGSGSVLHAKGSGVEQITLQHFLKHARQIDSSDVSSLANAARQVAGQACQPKEVLQYVISKIIKKPLKKHDVSYACELLPESDEGKLWTATISLNCLYPEGGPRKVQSASVAATKKDAQIGAARAALQALPDLISS
eukprot:TRINITY_DN9968_c0_g1_i1.p1 TRINITY_DN9968_c0_g1~~TRINITY_DN9968_c0_g1_i1.p1  ORF type:complete len:1702 (-),score=321.91 TRINITY_DN9968_c0_g1_i1:35-5113(-)